MAPSTTTTTSNISYICAAISFAAGAGAFYMTQAVTKETFDPIVTACMSASSYSSMEEFVNATGYHAYDENAGLIVLNPLVCLLTQFLFQLTEQEPIGPMVWYCTLLILMPMSVLITIEAGRQHNRGFILYPTLFSFLIVILGASVIFPALWVPAYCIWNNTTTTNAGQRGFVSITRARLAFPMTLPFVMFSILVFHWDTHTDLWKFSAGMLVGPVLASMPLLLWGLGPPLGMSKEEQVISTETCAFAYAFAGILGLIGWFYLGYTYAIKYGTDYEPFLNELWQDANPSVKFMVVDTVVLWIGMMLLIASKSLASFIEALLFTPFFGPGAACALALASNEMDHAPRLIPIEQQKKKDE